ncbi:MAG: dinitrogenase iron-molybdenum cofactor biosynthesis domain-containing protein [Deltaproteobacteria bacterium]|nr:MAG: dinitrogenase iron-molybdenum cofactor biosynthesis domain-containing protein [Deltaproteobacteria bacterium]
MKIAITVWGERISPVFDAASTLLIAELSDARIRHRELKAFRPGGCTDLLALLRRAEVQRLICGAICEPVVDRFETAGVEVIPFIAGEVEEILASCLDGRELSRFIMPGCRNGRCCRGRYKFLADGEKTFLR